MNRTTNEPAFVIPGASRRPPPSSLEPAFVELGRTMFAQCAMGVQSPELQGVHKEAPAGHGVLSCNVPELVRSAEHGDLNSVLRLLELGEDPNSKDDFDLTALHMASKKNHLEVAALLIKLGAEVNARSRLRGETPLHYAAKYGHSEIALLLLEGGADPSLATFDSCHTPGHFATRSGRSDIEAMLRGVAEVRTTE
eukprot:CAMPEP_0170586568 /NCGR_PEP_ID=MMETSP0224-20130122/9814_1 /TAXON_ID=285029 /ORGANISM="Togula jolla, Strain CCCM 725" /LENGTH=195 /DNA_ID=CAMNT_0010910123 /DNA_START=11 /DNA_END=598 /DNA_ORIENTATION=-